MVGLDSRIANVDQSKYIQLYVLVNIPIRIHIPDYWGSGVSSDTLELMDFLATFYIPSEALADMAYRVF
jgi:hypothetical protein